jgi:Domain of unknown function (DUF4271)
MKELIVRPDATLGEDWMFLVFLFSLATLAYTRANYPLRISRLWNSIWNVRILRQAIREEPNTPRANLLFNASFYLLVSLIIYLGLKWHGIHPLGTTGIVMYLLLLGCVLLAYALKAIGIRAVQYFGDNDFGLSEYEYNVFLINRGLGLALLPAAALLAYLPKNTIYPLMLLAALLYTFMVLYRMGRGLINASQQGVPLFYIFFYICTLEILPIVVCAKALSQ